MVVHAFRPGRLYLFTEDLSILLQKIVLSRPRPEPNMICLSFERCIWPYSLSIETYIRVVNLLIRPL